MQLKRLGWNIKTCIHLYSAVIYSPNKFFWTTPSPKNSSSLRSENSEEANEQGIVSVFTYFFGAFFKD